MSETAQVVEEVRKFGRFAKGVIALADLLEKTASIEQATAERQSAFEAVDNLFQEANSAVLSAEKRLAEVKAQADVVVEKSRAEADKIVEAAQLKADSLVQEACIRADHTLRDCKDMTTRAQDDLTTARQDLEHIKSIATTELKRLKDIQAEFAALRAKVG